MTDFEFEQDLEMMIEPEGDPSAFANAGLNLVAYIRPLYTDHGRVFAIHAANGEQYALADNANAAVGFIKQQDLEPVGLH